MCVYPLSVAETASQQVLVVFVAETASQQVLVVFVAETASQQVLVVFVAETASQQVLVVFVESLAASLACSVDLPHQHTYKHLPGCEWVWFVCVCVCQVLTLFLEYLMVWMSLIFTGHLPDGNISLAYSSAG